MLKVRILFLVIFPCISLNAQVDPVKVSDHLGSTYFGTIVFNDDSELRCEFTYNPVVSEGILLVKTDTMNQTYGVTVVKSFSFYDWEIKELRQFYSLPITQKENISRKYFFELIYDTNYISILGRNAVRVNTYNYGVIIAGNIPISIQDRGYYKNYVKYLFDHRDKKFYPFSKKQALELTKDKKAEIKKFLKVNNYSLGNMGQYIDLLNFYAGLSQNMGRNELK